MNEALTMSSPPCRAPRLIANTPSMTARTNAVTKPEPIAQWATDKSEPLARIDRDDQGRFLTGNSGGGRRKGSRNKLSENFLETIARDFAEHGAEAIERVRKENPEVYLKLLAWLVPRELILQRERSADVDPADLSDEELATMFMNERRRQMIRNAIGSSDD
jgi:hypothetical protein